MNNKEVNPLYKMDKIRSLPRLIFPNLQDVNKGKLPSYNPQYAIQTPYSAPEWADTRWRFRKNITIPSSKISEKLIDFPLYVELFDSDLQQWARTDGQDIMFTDSRGTQLAHENTQYKRVYNDTHAQFSAWVKTNLSASEDTIISLYFGNPLVQNLENVSSVWVNYQGVWHLDGTAYDSSPYGNHGTPNGTETVVGQLGNAQQFEELTQDRIVCGSAPSLANIFTGGGTVETWLYIDAWPQNIYPVRLLDKSNGLSGSDGWGVYGMKNTNKIGFERDYSSSRGDWGTASGVIQTEQWYHLVIAFDDTVDINVPQLNLNGVSYSLTENYNSQGSPEDDADNTLTIGNLGSSGYVFNGILDEVRLSHRILTAGWIAAEYANQQDPSTFYTVTSAEQKPIEDWVFPALRYRKPIVIHGDQISGTENLTDVPILIDIFDTALHDPSNVQSDANGLEFAFGDGTKTEVELEIFEQTYNATHAHLVAWVGLSSISQQEDIVLYMYYGNDAYESETITWNNDADFWDSKYSVVWHLEETNYRHYSSANYCWLEGWSGPPVGLPGKIGLCIEGENGWNEERFITNQDPSFPDNFTIEAWIRPDVVTGERTIVSRCNFSSEIQLLFFINDSQLQVILPPVLPDAWGNVSIEPHVWQHVALTYNGTTVSLFKNGILGDVIAVSNDSHYLTDSAYSMWVASKRHPTILSHMRFDGLIDEVRLSLQAHSADWIATSYSSQNNPNNFYTVGVQENYRYWWADGTFAARKDLILDGTNMYGPFGTEYEDYPFLIDLFDTDLHDADIVQATGADIIFTTTNGTKLHHHIGVFEQNYNATHAHLQAWIQIPFLTRYEHKGIVMYYSNENVDPQETPMAVWQDYCAVWHMEEDPTGTAPQLRDSSPTEIHGTASSTMTSDDLIDGYLGSGWQLDDVGDTISMSHNTLWDFSEDDELYIEAWLYLHEYPEENNESITIWGDTDGPHFFLKYTGGTSCALVWNCSSGVVYEYNHTFSLSTWHYVAVRRSWMGTTTRITFIGNDSQSFSANTFDTTINPDLVGVGFTSNTSKAFNGIIDEV
ncbi:MAG: LamG-like jellyroll fold domain-containing protein [Candidatus Hodarchaeales archaeon]|jgi:hypothetical protein